MDSYIFRFEDRQIFRHDAPPRLPFGTRSRFALVSDNMSRLKGQGSVCTSVEQILFKLTQVSSLCYAINGPERPIRPAGTFSE